MREKLPLFWKLSALLTILFVVVYGGTNWINSQRADVHRLYFDWELGIPFVPWMMWVYFSLNLYLALTLFLLDVPGLKLYAKTFALATLVGGAVHLVLPARLGFDRPAIPLDMPYNLVPSMHVTYATMTASILCLG
ncbi:MAG: hypothetical protein ACRD8O_23485, partial [Bryobacteraceae bacterium]